MPAQNAMPVAPVMSQVPKASVISTLHRRTILSKIVISVLVLAITAVNITASLHVLSVRKFKKENTPATKAPRAMAAFGPEAEDRTDGKLDLTQQVARRFY
jgi:hypothetical protein